jgi:uncharacterized protein (TIGR03086 family)
LRPLHRRALADGAALVRDVTPGDLGRDTPCAGWDVLALIAHVVGQHHGFALAVRHGDADLNAFHPQPPEPDRVADRWVESADALDSALDDAPPDRPVRLAEISPDARFPLALVVAMQLVDTLAHTWDLARGVGRDYRPAPELVAAGLEIARLVPDDETRHRPDAPFAPAVPGPDDADDWDVMLRLLGRDPGR